MSLQEVTSSLKPSLSVCESWSSGCICISSPWRAPWLDIPELHPEPREFGVQQVWGLRVGNLPFKKFINFLTFSKFMFSLILYWFQVYRVVVRQSHTLQSVPPNISGTHLASYIVSTISLTIFHTVFLTCFLEMLMLPVQGPHSPLLWIFIKSCSST